MMWKCLDEISKWCDENAMKLNVAKCLVMFFSHSDIVHPYNYSIKGASLKVVEMIRSEIWVLLLPYPSINMSTSPKYPLGLGLHHFSASSLFFFILFLLIFESFFFLLQEKPVLKRSFPFLLDWQNLCRLQCLFRWYL